MPDNDENKGHMHFAVSVT